MESNNIISVIVPIYNLEKYIERCVKSILGQTYKNLEIILVDDGSQDNSRAIIEQLKQSDQRIKTIFQENGGVTSARLSGIKAATGEWIGFVDGDDEIENDMYELLLKNAVKYHADISHCGYQMIFEDGRRNYFYNSGQVIQQDRIKGIKDLLEGTIVEPGLWNKLFRRRLFQPILEKNKMPFDIKINEDLLMNYYLFSEAKNSVFEDVCMYHYIVRGNSATRSKINKNQIFDPIKVKKIIMNHAKENEKFLAKRIYICTCISVYNELLMCGKKEYILEKKQIRSMISEQKEWFHILGKKYKILVCLIISMPYLYSRIYNLYSKYILKRKYD